jgi:hypothetical protein
MKNYIGKQIKDYEEGLKTINEELIIYFII